MKRKLPLFLKPSTRAWLRETRQVKGFSFLDLLHSYIYGRWPYFYIGVGTGEHPLSRLIAPFATQLISLLTHKSRTQAVEIGPAADMSEVNPTGKAFADTYHGKVVPLEAAKQLVTIQQEIKITNLEKMIPYARARDIIMHNPDHIVVIDCPCRVAREHPCLPLDVCLIIGEPFASFIAEHQPQHTRWINSDEAIDILKAEDKRGHVHHAFFKDAMLGRFYAICNCCDCCCGAMQAHRGGTPMLASSGFRAVAELERCSGCAVCVDFCQFHALSMIPTDDPAVKSGQRIQIDPARCMGCGVCVNHCARKSLSLERDEARGEPLEIQKLMELV
jgi:Pyruvate/2-oxoacid:ferredoxin oxidoreductase delta subunit